MNEPTFIGVDWGTTSFRAYLADASGTALETREGSEGALMPSGHEAYLAQKLAGWPRLPVLACGMIGARQGWQETPYVPCPAGRDEIAAAMLRVPASFGNVRIAPGLSVHEGAPDVMRGEETQILGAGGGDGLYVLPGTHSKWAQVSSGRIVRFSTYMTGEVYAVLRAHSVLGRMMAPEHPGEGFARGVTAAKSLERPGHLLHAIFAARTFGLFETLPADQLGEYLSGLLIGAEILAGAGGAVKAVVIGSAGLAARYTQAGAMLGVTLTAGPENCALRGLAAML